jgi:hypothetical protein
MDRLKLIEVITAKLDEVVDRKGGQKLGEIAAEIADAIILSGALRSLRTPDDEPEGGTMPPGPWSGSG